MSANKDKLFQLNGGTIIAPVVTTSVIGAISASLDLQAPDDTGMGCQGAAIVINLGVSGDTLSDVNKTTITLSEGSVANGSDAVLVSDPASVMSNSGVGKDAQGNDFANGVIATIVADDDDGDYYIQYHGTKPVITVTITPAGTQTNGMPVCVNVFRLNPRRRGSATGF